MCYSVTIPWTEKCSFVSNAVNNTVYKTNYLWTKGYNSDKLIKKSLFEYDRTGKENKPVRIHE